MRRVIILKQRVFFWVGLFSLANPVHRFEIENAQPCMVLTFALFREFFSFAAIPAIPALTALTALLHVSLEPA